MKKLTRRILAIVLCAALVVGAVIGVLLLLANSRKAVNVYSVSNVSMDSYWGEERQVEGTVRYDRMQTIYLSETQKVTQIHVAQGQQVHAGDPLLSFDTTLTDISLQRKELSVQKLELELRQANEELQRISAMRPYVPPAPTPTPTPPEKHPIPEEELPYLMEGTDGTRENPYVFLCGEEMSYTKALIESMLGDKTQCYALFQQREDNAPEGDVLRQWAMTFLRDETDGTVSFQMLEPEEILPPEPEPEPTPEPTDDTSGYTAAEIAQMKVDQRKKISDLDLQVRLARVELARMRMETQSGTITAQLDGTVVSVLDEKTARQEGKPVVLVSGDGGFYVECTIGELNLSDVSVGDAVTVTSWESGGMYDGTISAISDVPAQNAGGYYGAGNRNVSQYPMTVQVGIDAALRENEWVQVSMQPKQQETGGASLYLENSFLRSEDGKSYVYVQDEEGILRQRFVRTGINVWGSYTQITDGLTADDLIAFPYGRAVRDGAKCREADISELYQH